MSDLKEIIVKALPWIGAAATGNVPALVALAAGQVSAALGVSVPPNGDAIATAVASATPEQQAALQERELAFRERMQAAGFAHAEELGRQALEGDKAAIADTAGARSQTTRLAELGSSIAWGAPVVSVLVVVIFAFCFWLMFFRGEDLPPNLNTNVTMLLGALVLAFGQVVNYWLGSSAGSKRAGDANREIATALAKKSTDQNSAN